MRRCLIRHNSAQRRGREAWGLDISQTQGPSDYLRDDTKEFLALVFHGKGEQNIASHGVIVAGVHVDHAIDNGGPGAVE